MIFLDAEMSDQRSQQMLWMVASDWAPLNSEGLIACVCLGFEILRVEDLMDAQVVGIIVPQRLGLVLTWLGA